jgi:hypothetical protein
MEHGEHVHFREALIALPADLARNIDRISTYRRNAEAKQLIRQCLQQYGQGEQYRSNGPSTSPSS